MDLGTLTRKVSDYEEVLKNTAHNRSEWPKKLIPQLKKVLNHIIKETGLHAKVVVKDGMENLNMVYLSLGQAYSGIAEKVEDSDLKRRLIKSKGSLVFQELFNGKILIMIMFPFIEGYGQPHPPKTLEILRPHELTNPFIVRYVETFLQEIIQWEDYDDDLSQQGQITPIGFQTQLLQTEED